MNGTEQMRSRIGEVETEVATSIGLGVGGFFHALCQFDKNHFVPGGWLARGSVLQRAYERLRGRDAAQQQHERNNFRGPIQTFAPLLPGTEPAAACSSPAIS